jgi:hypothetical protein
MNNFKIEDSYLSYLQYESIYYSYYLTKIEIKYIPGFMVFSWNEPKHTTEITFQTVDENSP